MFRQMFWLIDLAVVLMFAFFLALGAFGVGDVRVGHRRRQRARARLRGARGADAPQRARPPLRGRRRATASAAGSDRPEVAVTFPGRQRASLDACLHVSVTPAHSVSDCWWQPAGWRRRRRPCSVRWRLPGLAMDSAGTAFIAWSAESADSNAALRFCRYPRGATACDPGNGDDDPGPGRLALEVRALPLREPRRRRAEPLRERPLGLRTPRTPSRPRTAGRPSARGR